MDGHIGALVAKLSLEQKVRLLTGADFWTLYPEPAIGLRAMAVSDGPVGVRGTVNDERDTSANLPSATAIAASWDTALVARLARLLAAEARRKGIDVVLGPTVNLHRSPLGGRHFECYSEDPLLTARLAIAYVRALQDLGVGATPKHYVANDSETERLTVDVRVGERALRELYLLPFEEIVREAAPWMVMAAYNAVNGPTMTENPLLAEPLKGEWGFDGVVVSDWLAARNTVPAGVGGLDLAMPSVNSPWGDALVDAVRRGEVPESAVDEKVRRLLRLAGRVGALDSVAPTVAPPPPVPDAEIATLLRSAAADGMVLLANPDGLLPLSADALRSVAVIGPHAARARTQGGGSATVHPPYTVSPLEGLRAALGDAVTVTYAEGCRVTEGLQPLTADLVCDPVTGEPGVLVESLMADGTVLGAEHRLSSGLWLTAADLPPGVARLRLSGRMRADEAGTWRFGVSGLGAYTLSVDGRCEVDEVLATDAEVTAEFAEPPARSVARTLAVGDEVDLAVTYDVSAGRPFAMVLLGHERPPLPADAVTRAAGAARAADVAVVVVGTTERVESEGFDRTGLALPGPQDELVRAVAGANPRTVVVVNAGAPVLLPWRDEVGAVLLGWFGGQEMGNALADVLLGTAEPGGRLPTTWPAREEDVPVLSTRPDNGVLGYGEGIHIGYRAWLRKGVRPAYPFGFGLGYTSWVYEDLTVRDDAAGPVLVVRLRNAGTRAGKEVVQAYLAREDSAVERPDRWLAGFAVARAEPGETVSVTVPLAARCFAHWSVEEHGWRTEPGAFTVHVGSSVTRSALSAEIVR